MSDSTQEWSCKRIHISCRNNQKEIEELIGLAADNGFQIPKDIRDIVNDKYNVLILENYLEKTMGFKKIFTVLDHIKNSHMAIFYSPQKARGWIERNP